MQIKKDEVKENILKSAKYEFNKYGYIKASMVRLASRAKMSVGNVYKYFKNKEALFDEVVAEVYYTMPLGFKKLIDESADIDEFSDFLCEFYEKYSTEIKILTQKSHGSKYTDIKEKFTELVFEQIKKAFLDNSCNNIAVTAIASGAVECIISLLINLKNKKERKIQLKIALYFYFNDLNHRLKLTSDTVQK